ncbi:MAG: DUF3472 domain-containing protein [Prevotella sp.]|jgi:hypothetical protein|nr:DUF3472 domain-containing protein [Prevotella sp.]
MRRITLLIIVLIYFINIYGQVFQKTEQPDNLPAFTKKIPLGGNSYVSIRGASGYVSDAGFRAWHSKETVFSTWFRVNREGSLKLYLQYAADTCMNEIEVTCKNKLFSLTLPKPRLNKDTVVYIGTIDKCGTGYVQVDFRGKTLRGKAFAEPSYLLVCGEAAKDMDFVGDFSYYWGRRGPSVHLNYHIPEGKTAEWFYNEVTVPSGQDPEGSYFMANGFGEGYFGMQVNSATERRVLFSVWSPYKTDNPKEIPGEHKIILVKKGRDVKTGEFGNEGSGGQSYLIYNWKAGNTYRFLTHVKPSVNSYTEYTSYFYMPETGKWKLIAQFLRPSTTQYYTRPHSFLENFNPETGYTGRMAYYNNQWIYTKDGQWVELTKARFTADNTARQGARLDYKGGACREGFFLQNCGFFNENTVIDTIFDRNPTNNRPDIKWNELE